MVGISFKISRAGSRYKPKVAERQRSADVKTVDVGLICPSCKRHRTASTDGGSFPTCTCNSSSNSTLDSITESTSDEANGAFRSSPAASKRKRSEVALIKMSGDIRGRLLLDRTLQVSKDAAASFSVRLFPDGFSIGRPIEGEKGAPPAHEVMDLMYPYNRTSESFLRALDGGWIPGDLLEDIPCKYANGCVVCEIHDYRVNAPSSVDGLSKSSDWMPVVYKITLQPTTESIVKDVSSMVDETWTYQDLMEVESRILKTVWAELDLHPKPTSNQSEHNALVRSGHDIIKHYRTHKGDLMDRRLRLTTTAKPIVKQGASHSRPIQSSVCLAIPPVQFPPSPSSGMSTTPITPLGHEPIGITADNKLSNLGKRDGRDLGGKLETKKLKQEPLRLDKLQLQADKNTLKFEQKMTDQHLQDAHNYQQQFNHDKQQHIPTPVSQPPLGCSDQDLKVASSLDREDISEIMMKHDIEFQNNANLEQRRLVELVKLGEEQETLVKEEQEQHQDPQLSSQRVLQQNFGKPPVLPSQSWQPLDDLLQRNKPLASPKMLQKPDGRMSLQSLSNEIPHMSPTAAHNAAAVLGSSTNPVIVPSLSSLAQPKDKLQTQAAVSGVSGPSDSMLQLQQLSRRRANSLPKTPTGTAGVASPGSNVTSGGISNISSPSTSNMPHVGVMKSETSLSVAGPRKEPVESFKLLLSISQRYALPAKRKKTEQLPDSKKTPPSWQLLLVALTDNLNDDAKDPKRQRTMADSLVGGNVNVRKTRFLQFQRQMIQGTYYRRIRVRLVMCERSKDAMVEAVVQFGDDQDDETLNSVPHHVLPTMANAYAADLFAKQFCALMEKDGFELVEDQVQPAMPRANAPMNAATTARPMSAGASTLGSSLSQLSSPRALVNQHMPATAAVGGMTGGMPPMQPSSPGALAARMPPPGSASSRQISGGYLGQGVVSSVSKPLTIDGAAGQLSSIQHPQQHQQPLVQRAQQLVAPTQLAQLNVSNHNQAQQINPQMVANQGQLQQYFQHQQQQRQQNPMQRRLMGMGSLGPMGNLGGVGIPVSGGTGSLGNMVGINNMNNVVGISGMNNVSASMGGISGLGNVTQLPGIVAMGQNAGLGNLIGQQLRPGTLGPAQMQALSSKAHLTQGRTGRPVGTPNSTVRNPVDNLTAMNTSNQVHISAGLPMMAQSLSRGRLGLAPLQRAPVTSMGSPKVATSNMPAVAGQNFYLNAQQLSSQQQLNLQQLNPLQQNNQQPLSTQQSQLTPPQVNTQMQQQQQQSNTQAQLNSQQPKNPQPSLNPQQHSNSQPQQQQVNPLGQMNSASQQQLASQQLNGQQLVVGSLGSLVGGPASPQLSSQNLGSVTSSSMELPNANRGSSLSSSGQ